MGLSLKRIEPYYEQIYQNIKDLIFQGVYKPGDRIFEAQIAKEFSISRSPVREAVRVLVNEGLLVFNEKSQLEVYRPSLTDVEDIYRCRATLESLAVELTTKIATDNDLQEIEELLIKTSKDLKLEGKNKSELISLNANFHNLIVSFSRNSRLQKLSYHLRSLTHFYRVLNFEGINRKETIFLEHQEIFLQIKKREAKMASDLMDKHVMNDLEHLKHLLLKEK